jgi:flagellar motor switch protein FliN
MPVNDLSKKEVILGVPLKVRVVLGETKKKLAELLALTPGMVVETEKNVDENVDLYINNKIVARGEVVVIGESFGFRIKKILAPDDRNGVSINGNKK